MTAESPRPAESRKRAVRLPADLLDRPAGESARRIALDLLARGVEARAALERGDDPEALHDFRVALRRLRSHLRAYRGDLEEAAGRKLRRRLGKLAAATNPGRDAEVGVDLLRELAAAADKPRAAERRTGEALARRLATRRDATRSEAAGSSFLTSFDRLEAKLAERLGTWQVEVRLEGDDAPARTFRAALGDEVGRHAAALLEALESVHSAADEEAAHRARIEAKRLRYLLDPVAPLLPAAREPAKRLRDLQDLLGRANDLAVLAAELATEAAEAEHDSVTATARGSVRGIGRSTGRDTARARRPGGRTGRTALAKTIAAERAQLWSDFESRWLAPDAPEARALNATIATLVEALAP